MKKITLIVILFFAVVFNLTAQTTADEWFKKANEYYDKGDFHNAIRAYSENIKLDSANPSFYFYRSFAYFEVKNYDAVIADCNFVIKSNPNYPNSYAVRGAAYNKKGIYHLAISDHRIALEKGLDPNNYELNKSEIGDMWVCGGIYMDIVVNRFLGNTDIVTKNENWLKTVCDKNGVTRQEIETFYRNNVGKLIGELVDREFKEITVPASTATYVKQSLTNFYATPNQVNFNIVRSIDESQNVRGDTREILRLYTASMSNYRAFENMGSKEAAEKAHRSAMSAENALNERLVNLRKQLNVPTNTSLDWSGFWSGYSRILENLNADLAKRVRQ